MLLSNNVLYKVWNLEEVARRFVGSLPRITPIACEKAVLQQVIEGAVHTQRSGHAGCSQVAKSESQP